MEAQSLVFEDFKDRVGGAFVVADDDVPAISLTLEEAALLPERFARPGVRAPFSLIFLSPDPHVLAQRLYHLTHDAMGELTLFLVPIGKDGRGVSYQALFN